MEIKTVALIGAGAVGCYFVAGLKGKIRRESVGDRRWGEKGAAGTRRVMDQWTAVFPMCEGT